MYYSNCYWLITGDSEDLSALLPGTGPVPVLEESLLWHLVWVSSAASGAASLPTRPPLARAGGQVTRTSPSLLHPVSDIQPSHDHIKIHDRDV